MGFSWRSVISRSKASEEINEAKGVPEEVEREFWQRVEEDKEKLKSRLVLYINRLIEGLYTTSLVWWEFVGVLVIGILFGVGVGLVIAPKIFYLVGWLK